jgi:hypothetical protein
LQASQIVDGKLEFDLGSLHDVMSIRRGR